MMVGHTRDEMAAFFSIDDRVTKSAAPEAIAGRFRDYFRRRRRRGDGPSTAARFAVRRPGGIAGRTDR
ncbi:MAG: hypothetical protein IPI73_31060 [Betaproteobacteria bacterium]|nr:hypothetical protein [Betaproteobacteria bacterium]